MKWLEVEPGHRTAAWYRTGWMKGLGAFFAALSLASLAYVLLHLDLLPTTLPVRRESAVTVQCALSFVVFGINGAVILYRVRRHKPAA